MSAMMRGVCAHCKAEVAVKRDGFTRRHPEGGGRLYTGDLECPGSDEIPAVLHGEPPPVRKAERPHVQTLPVSPLVIVPRPPASVRCTNMIHPKGCPGGRAGCCPIEIPGYVLEAAGAALPAPPPPRRVHLEAADGGPTCGLRNDADPPPLTGDADEVTCAQCRRRLPARRVG